MITISIILNIILMLAVISCIWIYLGAKANHAKKKAEKEKIYKKNLIDKLYYFIHQVEIAESLRDLYVLHIKIWANGIHNDNFGPDKYGMFRTDDILMMVPEEVYLGNIWGLWTKQLPYWETASEDNRSKVTEQYRNILLLNMKIMLRELEMKN